uniref:Elongation factor Ts, mitochondrial n=1 Tax=Corethron hystrix TaxID=216773 RepID=A0A7S1BI86_9STRA|mmetsp:Transcript_27572/g.63214  ORF Transcript_27572/g.63214 Transcript_27572/m.63214 type:complete len:331 (+) Transcript_27572:174-1166(+)|eukprot:CAMPEP_0113306622 /NCGR_PEP_ID=MMETSP0010_2-20120614/5800_1 /TAXON_ID=216773 ORGANISM="Corethron hystrix, Strain 308" /NCGR_SAMPLE_ID=MMETSP0010_2 /ASSEMBLY_ACC=CAM_ASM_000155 /LENGTH=330 /DNA_ID=CAMNT_0000161327 /DNA_START=81 /DNA_END=1073 /DNA_ORIENTATION=- /assembly_acc=CAM_ASM_000155
MKFSSVILLLATAAAPAAAFNMQPSTFVRKSSVSSSTTLFAEVSIAMIKELREETGAGMMDCKKALITADGSVEEATAALRKAGLAKADKKASRVAAEGKVVAASSGGRSVVIEVNCETDFVAKDSGFLGFCEKVAGAALAIDGENVDALMSSDLEGQSVEDTRAALVSKIGENIQVRRVVEIGSSSTTSGAYVHMGKIGVLVELEGGSEEVAQNVAMHVAAMDPLYATKEDVPAEDLEKERAILTAQVEDSGKPANIIEKMVEGRLRKYLEEKCLVSQTYVKTNDKTVEEYLSQNDAKMLGFKRITVGEGIEKKTDDFAAEVAAMAGGN